MCLCSCKDFLPGFYAMTIAMLCLQSTLSLEDSSYEYPDKTEEGMEDTYYRYDDSSDQNYGYGAYSFNEYVLEDEAPIVLDCYTCHYSKHRHHEQGLPNCDDPFDEEGIPTIKCDGLCAKTRTIIGDDEYMLIRSCLPNCKDIVDAESSVYCCFGERCNGAKAGAYKITATLGSMVLAFGVVFLCCVSI